MLLIKHVHSIYMSGIFYGVLCCVHMLEQLLQLLLLHAQMYVTSCMCMQVCQGFVSWPTVLPWPFGPYIACPQGLFEGFAYSTHAVS